MGKVGADWDSFECFMAIWGYHRIDQDRDVVREDIYREVAELTGRGKKAVEYKVRNVAACDGRPDEEKPFKSSYPNAQKLLKDMFEQLWRNRLRIDELYNQYKTLNVFGYNVEKFASPELVSSGNREYFIEEGERITRNTVQSKRSATLVKEAKKYYSKGGSLHCAVCNFTTHGVVEIIEIHHLEPIQYLKEEIKISLDEAIMKVRPVCPICHAIIHSQKPPLSLEAARILLTKIYTLKANDN